MKILLRLALLIPLSMMLASCYIPYGYLTKIELADDGRYKLNYQGRLLSISFLSKIGKKEIEPETPEYEAEVALHLDQLQKLGFTNVEYTYPASYMVKLDQTGNINQERMLTFPSRNGPFLVIKLLKDNVVKLQSRPLSRKYIDELRQSNIRFIGNIVVWTSVEVTQHNANTVLPGNPDVYVWERKSLADPPLELVGKLMQRP